MANENYSDILFDLNDGYSLNEIIATGTPKAHINEFVDFLKSNNVQVEEAKCLNLYAEMSDILYKYDKEGWDYDEINEIEQKDIKEKLRSRKVEEKTIIPIIQFVKTLNYNAPIAENHKLIKEFLESHNAPRNTAYIVYIFFKRQYILRNIDKIYASVQNALSFSKIKKGQTVYCAFRLNEIRVEEAINKFKGLTNAFVEKATALEQNEQYNAVLALKVAKGVSGIQMAPFSDYNHTDKEILLNITDKNKINIKKVEWENKKVVIYADLK